MNTEGFITGAAMLQICGRGHPSKENACEDVILIKETDSFIFLGLADGQSAKKYCVLGGRRVLQAVSNFFYDGCSYSSVSDFRYIDELQFEITKIIRRTLYELSEEFHAATTDFSSTLVVMVIDKKSKQYISIHLGDGTIAGVHLDGVLTIISRSENGITNQYTWLTTSADMLLHLRLGLGSIKNYKTIYLLSDGAQALLLHRDVLIGGDATNILKCLQKLRPVDDASCIVYEVEE